MQTNIYSNTANTNPFYTKPGFFKRQFDMNVTGGQKGFDITFGLIMPILCLMFDPLFFKSWFIEYGWFGDFQLFAYGVAAIEIITFVLWMFPRQHPQVIGKVYGSIMLAGGIFSFILGIILLPFTLIGMLFIIGFLGFVPFLTAFVFWRNGFRAMKHGGWDARRVNPFKAVVLASVFALVAPFFFQWRVWQSTENWIEQIKENRPNARQAKLQMKVFSYMTNYTTLELKKAYHDVSCESDIEYDCRESYPERYEGGRNIQKERLYNAYIEITGNEPFN